MKIVEVVIILTIKFVLIVALISAVIQTHRYSYYESLRWWMMTGSLFLGYISLKQKNVPLIILYLLVAVLFNPIEKVILDRDTWHKVDYSIAIIFFITIIYDTIKLRK